MKRHCALGQNTARFRRPICREMDHAQSAGNQIPFANRFVDRNGGQLRHLIRARDKASAAARPKQLGVPNVVNDAPAYTHAGNPGGRSDAFWPTATSQPPRGSILICSVNRVNLVFRRLQRERKPQ